MIPAAANGVLASANWAQAKAASLAGDASTRRYLRLSLKDQTRILMLSDPADRSSFEAFVRIAAQLQASGLSAPEIFAADAELGIMLLEDFGRNDFTELGQDYPLAAHCLTDGLIHLAAIQDDWNLPPMTPKVMADMVAFALPDVPLARNTIAQLEDIFGAAFTSGLRPALRDVHAENLFWLPDRLGVKQVGYIDFQDAVMAPIGYDLISFVKDARHDVPFELQNELMQRFANALELDTDQFSGQAALIAFQRNLRIVGIFRKLAAERAKPAYLAHLPRVFSHISEALSHPALADIRMQVAELVPEVTI